MFESKKDFKGAVIGMIMGDGCIPRLQQKAKNHYMELGHSAKQKDYLLKKVEALKWLTDVRVYECTKKDNRPDKKNLLCVRAFTRTHPFYTKLYHRFYHDYRKTIDDHLMKLLTPMGLAFLYQDDGCLSWHENAMAVRMFPYMMGSKIELECITRWIAKRFGLEFRANGAGTSKKSGQPYWQLRLRMKDRQKFFDLIDPYVVPSMRYKVTPNDDWVQVKDHDKIAGFCKYCSNPFEREYKRRNRPNVFCSRECYDAFRHNGGNLRLAD